jgi:proline iminopeptidase
MPSLYPEIEPYDYGMLDVGDSNLVYWETCGNPDGKPVILLHGGPGSGWNTGIRRFFDPHRYKIIIFDQRGCGRSMPHASDLSVDLSVNTTEHLLEDIERLREFLGVERWMLFGGSWGSTLGLAYAQRNPDRVTEIILMGVTMTRSSEIDWLYRGVAPLFPEQWQRFQAGVPADERNSSMVSAYHRLLMNPDPTIHLKAAHDWCEWETSLESIEPNRKPNPRRLAPEFQLAFARLVTHYFANKAWLEDGILLKNAGVLAGIPGILIHGRIDFGAPLVTAWELFQVWPNSELVIVEGAGHSASDPGMSDALLAATDRFAARR